MSSYVPLDWVDGVTPVNEANLDHIEQGIAALNPKAVAGTVSGDPADIACAGGNSPLVVMEVAGTGGVLRSLQANQIALGCRLVLRNGATGPVIIRHNYAGSPPAGYAKFLTLGGLDLTLAANSGETAHFYYNGTWWTEIARDITPAAGGGGGGGGLDWEGAWAAGTAYVKGDVVTKDGVVYGAVNDSTGQTPPPASFIPTSTPIPLVTALPTTGLFDGMEVIFTDSLTAGLYFWRFRYVAARPTNKWVFVGGAPAFSQVDTNQSTTSSTYADLGTVGPDLTVPIAGLYVVEIGFAENSSTSGNNLYMSYSVAGAAVNDLDGIVIRTTGGSNGDIGRGNSRANRRTLAAGATLVSKYKVFSGDGQFGNRWMRLTPVAVGG